MNRHIHPHYEIANTQRFMTIGSYLAERISQTGCKNFFTVPGDFILSLLDELLRHPRLEMIGCCNELNAGYAADGYCRETGGLGCCVVTYMVGSLSALNAIAGAYAENLPLLLVCGGPNNNDENQCHIIHHVSEYRYITFIKILTTIFRLLEKKIFINHQNASNPLLQEFTSLNMSKKLVK